MKKYFRLLAVLCGLVGPGVVAAAGPAPVPTPSLEQKALAQKLAEAKTPGQIDVLIDQAPPALLTGRGLRDALVRIGYDFLIAGRYPEAEKADRALIHAGEKSRNEAMTAAGQMLLAAVLRETGHYDQGLAELNQALNYFQRTPGPTPEKLAVYQEMGITYLHSGNFRRAFTSLQQALHLARARQDKRGIIPALNSLGELFRDEGQPQRALELYEEARKEVGDDSAWNMAFIFNNIGMAYEAMGETDKALEAINRARVVAEKVGFRPRVATSLAVIGQIHLAAQEFDAAAESYEQSLKLSRDLHEKASEARALLGLSETHRAQKRYADALQDAEAASAIDNATNDHGGLARAQTEIGRNLYSLGRKDEAAAAFRAAIAGVENLRGEIAGGADETESFFETQIAPYHELVALLVESGKNEEAFAIAQRASARALLDILANAGQAALPNESDAKQRSELDEQLAAANRRLAEERKAPHPAADRLAALTADVKKIRAAREISEVEASHFQTPSPNTSLGLPELMPLLRDGKNVLLKFVVARDQTFLFLVHESAGRALLESFTLDVSRDELTKRVASFRQLLAERGLGWQESARALYAAILQKAEPFCAGATSLTIIPDGTLWELPFQVLQDGNKRCLLDKLSISYAPSLAFLTQVKMPSSNRAPRLFAIADPALGAQSSDFSASVIDESWGALPAAEEEAAELKKIYSPNDNLILTRTAAREATFKERAADFDILHFATHGVINDHAPLYSYLLMAQENLPPNEDGLLEAWELMRMKLHARLAVLAACETARGRLTDGEGVIGLAWAFLAAGCPTEVVSQWKIDSAAERELMVDFHRRVRTGATAAEALRAASLNLAKKPEYRHPFYWAPFVVIGRE